ncbi:MAG: amidohydrolase family protein, partial [Candidatus Asgardarchaeum sp.]
ATTWGAVIVGLEKHIGTIEVGKKADLIILTLKNPNVIPITYHPAAIVYSASSENVITTIINGEILMENKRILHMNEEEILKNAQKSLERILDRSGKIIETKWPYE